MKIAKKALSVLLSLTMLLGVFSLMSSALAPDSAVDLYVRAEKSTYAPGDNIKLIISVQTIPEVGTLYCGGQFSIAYNNKVFEPLNLTSPECDDHHIQELVGEVDHSNTTVQLPQYYYLGDGYEAEGGTLGPDEGIGYAWNAVITPKLVSENVSVGDAVSQKLDLFYFEMKVKDDAPAGTYHIGWDENQFVLYEAYMEDAENGGVAGWDDDYGYGTTANYSLTGTDAITITGEETGPSVDKASTAGAQVKFTTNAPETNGVDDDFKLRIKSEITQADWDTYFANTAEGGNNAITEVGIVAYQGTDGFSAETAKKVVNGEPTEKYSTAKTDYVQKTATNAYFGAIINLKHTTCNYDITYMGYVKYTDGEGQPQVAFYKTSYEAGVSTNYDTAVSTFLAQ